MVYDGTHELEHSLGSMICGMHGDIWHYTKITPFECKEYSARLYAWVPHNETARHMDFAGQRPEYAKSRGSTPPTELIQGL